MYSLLLLVRRLAAQPDAKDILHLESGPKAAQQQRQFVDHVVGFVGKLALDSAYRNSDEVEKLGAPPSSFSFSSLCRRSDSHQSTSTAC